jgi:hypothetical protein
MHRPSIGGPLMMSGRSGPADNFVFFISDKVRSASMIDDALSGMPRRAHQTRYYTPFPLRGLATWPPPGHSNIPDIPLPHLWASDPHVSMNGPLLSVAVAGLPSRTKKTASHQDIRFCTRLSCDLLPKSLFEWHDRQAPAKVVHWTRPCRRPRRRGHAGHRG